LETGMAHHQIEDLERKVRDQEALIRRLNSRLDSLEFGLSCAGSAEDPCTFEEGSESEGRKKKAEKGKGREVGPTRRGQRASRGRRGDPYRLFRQIQLGEHYTSEQERSEDEGGRSPSPLPVRIIPRVPIPDAFDSEKDEEISRLIDKMEEAPKEEAGKVTERVAAPSTNAEAVRWIEAVYGPVVGPSRQDYEQWEAEQREESS
jgi:hypothetical protein